MAETTGSNRIKLLKKIYALQEAMSKFKWEKDGVNRHQSYKYITERQYKSNFAKALSSAKLLWKMDVISHEYIADISDKQHMMVCTFKGCLIDPDTGEKEVYALEGTGADGGDKALYKAITGAHKFFLASNFNISEDNDAESDIGETTPVGYTTPEKREEVKVGLLNTEGQASKMQITALKKALKLLREADPKQEVFINEVVTKTDSFKNITKTACETLILTLGEMIETAKGVVDGGVAE